MLNRILYEVMLRMDVLDEPERPPARYHDFRMEGKVRRRQGTDGVFQTGHKSLESVRFPPAITRTSP